MSFISCVQQSKEDWMRQVNQVRIRANNMFMKAMGITQEDGSGTDGDSGNSDDYQGPAGDDSDSDYNEVDDGNSAHIASWEKCQHPPLTATQRAGLHDSMRNCGVEINYMPKGYYAFIQRVAKTYVASRASKDTPATEDMHEDRDVVCVNSVSSVMEEIPEDQRPHDGLCVRMLISSARTDDHRSPVRFKHTSPVRTIFEHPYTCIVIHDMYVR